MSEDGDNGKRSLSRAEKFRNYCVGLGALTALILGAWANLKGEPRAEKTWETLRDQVNELTETVNKLTKRVIFLQAHESGRTAAEIQLKLDAAEAAIAKLKAPQAKPSPPEKKCREGYVLAGNRCRKVSKAVSKKLEQAAIAKTEAHRKLLVEKKKRLEEERRRRKLMQQLAAPHPPAQMKKLPLKLDEAVKK
jgi:hypothetical protein